MKRALRQLIRTLRSGEVEQGIGALLTPEGKMCCLGVACKIICPEGFHEDLYNAGDSSNIPFFTKAIADELHNNDYCNTPSDRQLTIDDAYQGYPPRGIMEALGLPDVLRRLSNNQDLRSDWGYVRAWPARLQKQIREHLNPGFSQSTFGNLNDGGVPFSVIADLFEYLGERQDAINARRKARRKAARS